MKIKESFTELKRIAVYTICEGDNEVSLALEKAHSGKWEFKYFWSGRIGKTIYRADANNDMVYVKSGRGREGREAKREIQRLYELALKMVNNKENKVIPQPEKSSEK